MSGRVSRDTFCPHQTAARHLWCALDLASMNTQTSMGCNEGRVAYRMAQQGVSFRDRERKAP